MAASSRPGQLATWPGRPRPRPAAASGLPAPPPVCPDGQRVEQRGVGGIQAGDRRGRGAACVAQRCRATSSPACARSIPDSTNADRRPQHLHGSARSPAARRGAPLSARRPGRRPSSREPAAPRFCSTDAIRPAAGRTTAVTRSTRGGRARVSSTNTGPGSRHAHRRRGHHLDGALRAGRAATAPPRSARRRLVRPVGDRQRSSRMRWNSWAPREAVRFSPAASFRGTRPLRALVGAELSEQCEGR